MERLESTAITVKRRWNDWNDWHYRYDWYYWPGATVEWGNDDGTTMERLGTTGTIGSPNDWKGWNDLEQLEPLEKMEPLDRLGRLQARIFSIRGCLLSKY